MKIRTHKTKFFFTIIVLTITTLAFQVTDIYFLIKKNFTIFSEVYKHVAIEYVDQVDPEVLMRNGLNAMLETLDPYTVYYNESQNEQAEILSRSNYSGIGIDAGFRNGEIVIIAPIEGGPADLIGIRAGDIILKIDGISTQGLQPEEVQNLTLGEVGSYVNLMISRYGFETPLEFKIERKSIEIKNVTFSDRIGSKNEFGFVRLAQFGMNAGDEIRTAISELQKEGNLEGLVLDLRDNPGGILGEAVSIIDKFIEPGINVVETRGRIAEYNQIYKTQEPVFFDKPIVLLINGGSASASEVVAGALQDLDRAVVVGERSFGKGLVQIVKSMPYNTSLKITISRYYTPSGRSIQSVAYTHNSQNAIINREDTTSRVFRTRNERSVNEGRGIEPDIELSTTKPSLLEVALFQQGSIFNFATQYESLNTQFNYAYLPDQVYDSFIEYLTSSNFDLNLESELILDQLVASLDGIRNTAPHINALKDSIEEEKKQIFESNKTVIKEMLYLELISRYQGQKERTKASFKFDAQLKKAVELLSESLSIKLILDGKN